MANFWYFITGLVLLYIFLEMVMPNRSRSRLLPGQTRRLLGLEGFASPVATFYMFGTDRCPHCRNAKPDFLSLGATTTIGGKEVAVRLVDPEQEPDVAKGFDIQGYPTFYLDIPSSGQKVKYTGARTRQAFLAFLQQHIAA